ncbi:MAG TPA: alcohol dehydrogenase catalytic domain-containing protein [Anaerolineaceae bacterium]
MTDRLLEYRSGKQPLPEKYLLWPLYGAGFENMGVDGKPIEVPMPSSVGADELLVRHDACGLCFSDLKVIAQGQNHPRIFRDMKKEPVTLGHEVSMTVILVGENLKGMYKPGDRLIIEADIYLNQVSYAYGYTFQGGLSQYAIIDPRVIHSDTGNNLIPVQDRLGYAEGALVEPWACVLAAYRLQYRTQIKPGGTLWVIGRGKDLPYSLSSGFDSAAHPAKVIATTLPEKFGGWLKKQAETLGVEWVDAPDPAVPPVEFVDDIVLLGADPDLIEQVSPHLAQFGVMAILDDQPMSRKVNVDIGRVHYHRWLYTGTTSLEITRAYTEYPVQAQIKPGGRALFVGAGGPIGRMHVQRAIQFANPPSLIVCTDVSDLRLEDLCTSFSGEARAKGIEFVCLNPTNNDAYKAGIAPYLENGFDYVVVLAPVAAVIADSANYLGRKAVMNVFAGVARGTMAAIDLSKVYLDGNRIIGHSGSDMSDMLLTLERWGDDQLSLNMSVAAIGSLSAARDGLMAVKNTVFPGKVVIFPNISELPLTPLEGLKDVLPTVYARLKNGREWTAEAEEELFRQMLP